MVTLKEKILKDSSWSTGLKMVEWAWSTGAEETSVTGGMIHGLTGTILGIKAMPDQTSTPDDLYDIKLVDLVNGQDVLNGAGENLKSDPTAVDNIRRPVDAKAGSDIPLFEESLQFVGTNLGSSAAGKFQLVIKTP